MKSLFIAFAMYSKIPTPQTQWDERGLAYALCYFPFVGVVVGLALWGWIALAQMLGLGELLFAVVAVVLPIAISGGIHLDGFCDTCDGLASHQSREKKLEIMKDPNAGAFAVIGCILYLLLFVAVWSEVDVVGNLVLLCAIPVCSRSLSGLFAMSLQKARGDGLLVTFTNPKGGRVTRVVLALYLLVAVVLCGLVNLWLTLWLVGGCSLVSVYYVVVAKREFGGTTGDLAGWFLQLCELVALVALVVGQKLGGLL